MAQMAAFDDVKHSRRQREVPIGGLVNVVQAPVAFFAAGTRERVIRPHFHPVDQFRGGVKGGAVLGRHCLALHAVHFARAHTPRRRFADEALAFLTLRADGNPGVQCLLAQRAKLERAPERKPRQMNEAPRFESSGPPNVQPFAPSHDDRARAAYALRRRPEAAAVAPSVAGSNGRYLIVTRGRPVHGRKVQFARRAETCRKLRICPDCAALKRELRMRGAG